MPNVTVYLGLTRRLIMSYSLAGRKAYFVVLLFQLWEEQRMFSRDLVLEGVRPADIIALRQLRDGDNTLSEDTIRRLEAKGWVEAPGGVPLITLTGGTLLQERDIRSIATGDSPPDRCMAENT